MNHESKELVDNLPRALSHLEDFYFCLNEGIIFKAATSICTTESVLASQGTFYNLAYKAKNSSFNTLRLPTV